MSDEDKFLKLLEGAIESFLEGNPSEEIKPIPEEILVRAEIIKRKADIAKRF